MISIHEHKQITEDELSKAEMDESEKSELCSAFRKTFKDEKKDLAPRHLGIDGELKAGYYIGVCWVKLEGKESISVQVLPKKFDDTKKKIDYIRLFATALEVDSFEEAEYFSGYYSIDFEESPVEVSSDENLITPLLLFHYLTLLTHLSKKGLRKGYVHREENLQSKVRGRISFIHNLRKNVLNKRENRNCCKFQEYTVDTPENRFLKKALLVAESQLKNIPLKSCEELFRRLGCIKSAFFEVSDDFSESRRMKVSPNKLYPHYAEAVRVAEMILRYFDRDMNGSSSQVHSVRPFCIDMSRLYEMYVLHLLKKAYPGKIHFQVKGSHWTQVDFIKTGEDEKIILDAKYKPRYEKGDRGIVDDVREISGYARDNKILKILGWNPAAEKGKYLPDCVIVYPAVQSDEDEKENEKGDPKTVNSSDPSKTAVDRRDENEKKKTPFDSTKTVVDQCDEIKFFSGFYKIAVPLPIKGE